MTTSHHLLVFPFQYDFTAQYSFVNAPQWKTLPDHKLAITKQLSNNSLGRNSFWRSQHRALNFSESVIAADLTS